MELVRFLKRKCENPACNNSIGWPKWASWKRARKLRFCSKSCVMQVKLADEEWRKSVYQNRERNRKIAKRMERSNPMWAKEQRLRMSAAIEVLHARQKARRENQAVQVSEAGSKKD